MLASLKKPLTKSLLSWYDSHKRDLPWRRDPTPYHIWVSEVMLQQTQVKTVLPYYHRFLSVYPTIDHLAQAETTQLHKLWEGLGYYSRADNLKRAAIEVRDLYKGALPADYQKLLALPGIGPYTAGAIASMAFQLPFAAVDGNVLRVYSRLLAYKEMVNTAPGKRELTEVASALLPQERPGDFNQALMDLGATVCLANGEPLCTHCPWQAYCRAKALGTPRTFPLKKARKARRIEYRTVVIPIQGKRFWIQKRPEQGLLSGLWEFINLTEKVTPSQLLNRLSLPAGAAYKIGSLGKTKHLFTHIEWRMTGFSITIPEGADIDFGPGLWVTLEELRNTYSLPSAFAYYRKKLSQILQA